MNPRNPPLQYRLLLTEELSDLIREMHPNIKKNLKNALKQIVLNPYEGKSLREELEGLRSLRANRIRIIYRIVENEYIEIVAIGPRKSIYEETFRIIQKEGEYPKKT